MSAVLTLTAPPDLSVGRIRLTLGSSQIGEWIASATEPQQQFSNLVPGIYQAVVEPLGQPSRSFLFRLNDGVTCIDIPSVDALSAPGFALSNFQSVAGTVLLGAAQEVVREAVNSAQKLSDDRTPPSPVGLGLSICQSFRTPNLSPAPGLLTQITMSDGLLEVLLDSAAATQPDAILLVLNASVGGTRDQFVRVPLFTGGVRFSCSASPLGTADLSLRILPAERARRAITQALSSGSSAEAAPVFRTLPGGKDELIGREDWQTDPWTAVAICLLCFRFPDLAPAAMPVDLSAMVERYPALPDASILLARERLRQAAANAPSVQERATALREVLDLVASAYASGPPFFAYAMQLAEELLGAIGSDQILRQMVRSQLEKMHNYQTAPRSAGVSYKWYSPDLSPTPGTLDPARTSIIFSGWVNQDRVALNDEPPASLSATLGRIAAPAIAAFTDPIRGLLPAALSASKASWADALLAAAPKASWADAFATLGTLASSVLARREAAPAMLPNLEPNASLSSASMMTTGAAEPPALARQVVDADDPYRGRFGGKDKVGGFTLSARFSGEETAKRVGIILTVSSDVTDGKDFESFDDVVEFYLHPTFRPNRLRATFRGKTAEVRIVSIGGFTVGAWLPKQCIELELNLAEVASAPRVIREL